MRIFQGITATKLSIFLALLFGAVALLALAFQLDGYQNPDLARVCYALAVVLSIGASAALFWHWLKRWRPFTLAPADDSPKEGHVSLPQSGQSDPPNPLIHSSTRVTDLADEDNKIRNRTFEHCTLYGPAVVLFTGVVEMDTCRVEDDPDSVFLETSGKKPPNGSVIFVDCTFRRCTFSGIGIAGPSNALQRYKNLLIFA